MEDETVPETIGRDKDAEVPEADAFEQRQPAIPADTDEEQAAISPDAPEADALDQSRDVPIPDDVDR
jgi:hypothetical protein